jgi:hypothetical protein
MKSGRSLTGSTGCSDEPERRDVAATAFSHVTMLAGAVLRITPATLRQTMV